MEKKVFIPFRKCRHPVQLLFGSLAGGGPGPARETIRVDAGCLIYHKQLIRGCSLINSYTTNCVLHITRYVLYEDSTSDLRNRPYSRALWKSWLAGLQLSVEACCVEAAVEARSDAFGERPYL